jgi:hypothetical protein
MPTRITVVLKHEVGPPDCQSLQATCSMLDDGSSTLEDPEVFRRAVSRAIAACQGALQEATAL